MSTVLSEPVFVTSRAFVDPGFSPSIARLRATADGLLDALRAYYAPRPDVTPPDGPPPVHTPYGDDPYAETYVMVPAPAPSIEDLAVTAYNQLIQMADDDGTLVVSINPHAPLAPAFQTWLVETLTTLWTDTAPPAKTAEDVLREGTAPVLLQGWAPVTQATWIKPSEETAIFVRPAVR